MIDEFKRTRFSISSFHGILNYLFVERLKEQEIKIDLLIDWNENQPIDKGLIKGMRDYYPNTYIKGYQGYIISTDYNFYIQPTDYEINVGVIPNEICVVGKGLEKRIKKFSNKIDVTTAPAFRFNSVYQNFERKDFNRRILVALSTDPKENFDQLSLLSNALKLLNKEFNILVKPHPSCNISKLIKKLGGLWISEFNVVDGEFNKIVSNVDMLVGSASSSLVETVSRGIPVIVICKQNGFTINSIPTAVSHEIWRLVETVKELAESIKYFSNLPVSERKKFKELGEGIKKDYFEPVTKETVKKFLNSKC